MSLRASLTLGLVVAAAIVALVLWSKGEPDTNAATPALVASQAPAPAVDPGAVEVGQRASVIVEPEAAPEPPPSEEEGVEQSAEDARVTLHGSVVVIDPEGVEHPGEDGTMVLVASRSGWGDDSELAVVDGLWSCEVHTDARVSVRAIELGGRMAFSDLDWRNEIAVPANRFLAVEARWPPPSILVVRARDTGLELDGVQVVGDLPLLEGGEKHPGQFLPEHVLIASGSSPIELAAGGSRWDEQLTLYARSPGYAWGRIEVDLSLGGERLLMLGRGGDLRVSFRGHAVAEGTFLSIQLSDESRPAIELPLLDVADVEFESLEEGPYGVVARVGRWFEESIVLGSGEVDVVAGRRSSLVLTLDEPATVQFGSLVGKVVIPSGWPEGQLALMFRLQGAPHSGGGLFCLRDLKRTSDQPAIYEWSVPEIKAGLWEIEFTDPPCETMVEVEAGRRSEVTIEVPPPAPVRLRVVERGTDLMADLDRVIWKPHKPPVPRSSGVFIGGSLVEVRRNPESGLFEFQASVGKIEVTTSFADEYERIEETFEIRAGLNELTMEAERSIGVEVVLKDGSTVIPWDSALNVELERDDGGPVWVWGMGGTGPGVRLTVKSPGLYRITIPDIDGYLPVRPLEIQFAPGPHPTIEVPLTRTR